MTIPNHDIILFLENFDKMLDQWFNSDYRESTKTELRANINQSVSQAEQYILDANCSKRITVAPPPAIGGHVIKDANPFDMIFESVYGLSAIPTLRDMTQQAIGVYRNGKLKKERKQDQTANTVPDSLKPEKITILWLIKHVPITLWLTAAGLLIAVFLAGIKASKSTLIKEIFGSP